MNARPVVRPAVPPHTADMPGRDPLPAPARATLARTLARTLATAAAVVLTARVAPVAADPPPTTAPVDRSAYTLFHPVPDDQQRAFNPDRPSVSTGPFTVDAGHVQVESSFVQYTRDQPQSSGGPGGDLFSVLPTETRVGVLNHVEVDLTVSPFLYQRTPAAAVAAAAGPPGASGRSPAPSGSAAGRARGFGDLQLQSKVNLFGDDADAGGGPPAVALAAVPYLTLPTAAASRGLGTGRVQGGVLFPVQASLPADFTLGGQVEVDFPRNDADTATGVDVLHSVIVGHALVGPLAAYAEYVGVAPLRLGHGYQAYVDAGLTYAVSDDVQLDGGINVGRSRDTAAYTILAGITVRR